MTTQSPFDPQDFLGLAAALSADTNARQAELRSAISRAYYGAFLLAKERLAQQRLMTPSGTGRDHLTTISTLRSRNRRAGDELDKLRLNRNTADYQLAAVITHAQATQALSSARTIVSRL